MSPEEQEAAMAALEHIQDTLASVKGLKLPGAEEEAPVEGPPVSGEPALDEPAELAELDAGTAEPVEASEPEPERFLESMGSPRPTTESIASEEVIKRGPGRPKKVR